MLSIQTVFRDDIFFRKNLELLKNLGFYGVELNIAHFDNVNIDDVIKILNDFGLVFTNFASGLTAKTYKLSLSEPEYQKNSIQKCKDMIDYVSGYGVGIILGFIKGNGTREVFAESLKEISQYCRGREVVVMVEATNHHETPIANTLQEAVGFVRDFGNPFLRILPDTYHMNIEEKNALEELNKYKGFYSSIHFSDDNRYLPGLGSLDFGPFIKFVKDNNIAVALEGNIKDNFIKDVTFSRQSLLPF